MLFPEDDLRDFRCRACGKCCLIRGFVRVTDEEIAAIARELRIAEATVRADYTVQNPFYGRAVTALRDHPDTTRCIFLDAKDRCRIHAVKPRQCSGFPIEWRGEDSHLYCEGLRRLRKDEVEADV